MSDLLTFTNDNIIEKIDEYYKIYLKLFKESCNYINNEKIEVKRFPDVECYDYTFFHMITKELSDKECECPRHSITCEHPFSYNPFLKLKKPREICPNRILAIPCLEDYFNKKLLIWSNHLSKKGYKERILCLDVDDRYLIILEHKNNNTYLVISGFPVEQDERLNRLIKKYNEYKETCKDEYITCTKL